MAAFTDRTLHVLADMAGCPNRCHHCWLSHGPNKRMSVETLHWIVEEFKNWRRQGEPKSFCDLVKVQTWYREPDFAPNYRELYELEKELNGGTAERSELLSIWRLARDEGYAQWARDVSTDACQITFFGMEEVTDEFAGRRGAFHDNIVATERLLAVGIRPRWQLIFTTRILPELDDLVRLVRSMNLERRVRQVGGEFELFLNLPSPDGEAWNIEYLRPESDDVSRIPPYLVEKTKAHGTLPVADLLGRAERDLLPAMLEDALPCASYLHRLAFMVTPDLEVFSNVGDLMPWWSLGSLTGDGIEDIMRRFEHDDTPGMWAHFHIPVRELAGRYGQPESQKLYAESDLKTRLVREWASERWQEKALSCTEC